MRKSTTALLTAIFAVLGLLVVGVTTASATIMEGDCTCTDDRKTCDPNETPNFSKLEIDDQGIIDEDGNRIVKFAKSGSRLKPHIHINTHSGGKRA